MSFNLTIASLEYWLKQPEYRIPEIRLTAKETADQNYRLMESNNRILGRSFHHTFERWFRKWKRIPTPQEFIAMQMQDVKKNYSKPSWRRNHHISFKWTPTVEKGIKQRLLRSYISFINELHTELLIKELFPWVVIERSDELDFSGVDILAIDKKNQVNHQIHITKNSEYAIDFLFKKEGKMLEFRGYKSKLWAVPIWKRSKHFVYQERSFQGHVFLLYDTANTSATRIVNGYPLFEKSYIKNKLEVNIEIKRKV